MGGGKKKRLQSGRSSKSRYFSSPGLREKKASSTYACYGDHRLAPRIKEYLGDRGNHAPVDVSEMALALQAEYSEYARKKKVAFRNLVAKVYKSLKDCHAAESQLERLEREHVRRRAVQREEEEEEEGEGEEVWSGEELPSDLSSDSDADFEAAVPEGYNMMNDSLLQVYNSLSIKSPFHDSSDLTDSPSKDLILNSGSNGAVTSETNPDSPQPTTYETSDPLTSPAISEDLQTETSSHESNLEKAVEEKEVTVTAGEEVVRNQPAVSSVAPDVQEPQLPDSVPPKGPSSLSASSPLLPFPGESEPPPLQQQQPSRVTKRVTFAPKVTEYTDNGRRGKVEKNSYQTRSSSSRVKLKRGAVEGETEDNGSMRQKSKRRKVKEGDRLSSSGADASLKRNSLTQKHSTEFSVEKSDVRFSDIGGCESCLKEVCQLLLHLVHPEVFRMLGVRPHQGFLLHGPPGCGKTLLAHAIAGELDLPFIKLAATEVVSGVSGESEQTIRDLFQQAREHSPCVLFIDEIDAICPKRETAQREMERRIVTQLLACLDELNRGLPHGQVLVIGATSRPDTLDPALRRAGRFDREVSLGIPDEQARERILRVLCRGLKLEEGFMFSDVAHRTPGFVGADLMALTREASLLAINRVLREANETEQMDEGSQPAEQGGGSHHSEDGGGEDAGSMVQKMREQPQLTEEQLQKVFITFNDFSEALGLVQPSAKREGFATVPDMMWDDVGALESIREELSIAILAPVRYPRQFAELGLASSPPGILLAGPPGCGKTLLAKAIANETGINFISVKGPELLNMYVGESERAVRQVFQRARNSAPCVIFFDELDALCPKRSETAETSASARVVNQLLTEMDGLETRKQVFIMAATNRPDIIDPAVMRPGRLDKVLYVGLPTATDRADILRTITKGGTRPKLDSEVDLSELAGDTYCCGFSGADLTALVREAAVLALREHMQLTMSPFQSNQSDCSISADSCVVSTRHFTTALKKIKPSVSQKDQAFYNQMAQQFSLK